MMKEGRYRAIRNLPVGWVLQIIHSTDTTERWVRICLEMLLIALLWGGLDYFMVFEARFANLFSAIVIVHSLSWYFVGNFWVYMLDSFLWVKNPGMEEVVKYVEFVRRVFLRAGSVDAILIYGSMCRRMFHGRSDLDLRVVRSPGMINGIWAVLVGILVRIPASLRRIPVDLQVVDSMRFLDKQMREEEHPIIVYRRDAFQIHGAGPDFSLLKENSELFLRDTRN